MLVSEDGTSASIEDVQRDADGTILHTATAALPVGATVTVKLDWPRRFDHMQHHTVGKCSMFFPRM